MPEFNAPIVSIGGMILLGSYCLHLGPNDEAVVELVPSPNSIVLRLEEYDVKGDPKIQSEMEDHATLVVKLLHIKSRPWFATIRPWRIGNIAGTEIWVNLAVRSFDKVAVVDLAVYTKPQEEDAANGEAEG